MLALVVPHTDPTLRLVPDPPVDEVIDVARTFVADVLEGSVTPRRPSAQAELLLAAGQQAAAPDRSPLTRLRGLGALLTGLETEDAGVRLTLDDLELTEGSTERGLDVMVAAARPAAYDAALAAGIERAARAREVRLVVERDQQLPAAVRAASELSGSAARVELTGRFATNHWQALRALPPFAGVRLAPAPRGLRWRVAGLPDETGDGRELEWRERATDPHPDRPWAGRLGLRNLIERQGEPDAAHTVVVGLCATAPVALGRGGFGSEPERVRAVVAALRRRGVRALAELWLGAPRVSAADAERAVDGARDLGLPVVGLRAFDWPVDWTRPRWGNHRVRWFEEPGLDLARHHRLEEPERAAPEPLVARLGPQLAREGSLVPGRVAGAYLYSPRVASGRRLVADPDVVMVEHANAGPGRVVAVNLRIGRVSAISATLGHALDGSADESRVASALAAIPQRDRDRRISELLARGVLAWTA